MVHWLQRSMGLRRLSLEEAQAKLDATPEEPLSAKDIESIVESVAPSATSGETLQSDANAGTDVEGADDEKPIDELGGRALGKDDPESPDAEKRAE